VVEINPGYLQLIEDYPQIAAALKDPRVRVHVDDGRRWLKRNPDARYDLVVMNTTFHWRNYSTNLLSREFLQLVKRHMQPGAVITYNATGSPDVLRTAESVFPHAFRYVNFVTAADHDFRPLVRDGEAALLRVKLDGQPLFDPRNEADRKFIRQTLSEPFVSMSQDRLRLERDPEIITDWNMITEYRYGKGFP
jgi:spermidine synthase